MALFSKGIMLEQHKEPALSSRLVSFTNPRPSYFMTGQEISKNPKDLSSRDIINVAKQANIYDERDGRLLVSKLRRVEGKATQIIVDAIDDEPYLSSKLSPLLQLTDLVEIGIDLCRKVGETDDIIIQTYRDLGEIHSTIPSKVGGYSVQRLSGGYPTLPVAGGRGRGRSHRGERLVVGVGALVHLARAVTQHIPQTTTFITVAGNSVANPMNMEISLGMNFSEILERCGLSSEPSRIIAGGPMTGIGIIDPDNTVTTPTTRGVLAVGGEVSGRSYECISCGRCEKACPVGLNPMYIRRLVERKQYTQLKPFDPQYCIGCGTCSYVCPSRLDVSGAVKEARDYAKQNLLPPEEREDDLEI